MRKPEFVPTEATMLRNTASRLSMFGIALVAALGFSFAAQAEVAPTGVVPTDVVTWDMALGAVRANAVGCTGIYSVNMVDNGRSFLVGYAGKMGESCSINTNAVGIVFGSIDGYPTGWLSVESATSIDVRNNTHDEVVESPAFAQIKLTTNYVANYTGSGPRP